jgi:hypothetical protein
MSRWPVVFLGLLFLAGCLEEGPAPSGRRLFAGLDVESPAFTSVASDPMVLFQNRLAAATPTTGGFYDVWISAFDGSQQRKVLANRTDRWGEQDWGWSQQDYPLANQPSVTGEHYFMANEALVASGTGNTPVASLVRLGPTYDEELRIDGITNYSRFTLPISLLLEQPQSGQSCPGFPGLQNNCPQLFFERPAQVGESYPTLFLWDGQNQFPIGKDSGSFQIQTMGSGASYFVLDSSRTLTRLHRPGNALESLRANVSRFYVSGDERYVALAVTDPGKSMTVIRDLTTGVEISPATPNPSAWGGFQGSSFYYSQSATSAAQAELHTLNLTTGDDSVTLVPRPLVDIAGTLDRPGSDERLVLDSAGRGVFTGKGDLIVRRVVSATLITPNFTPDGAYLTYIAQATATLFDTGQQGALVFQDAELLQPPVTVSPPGLVVSAQNGSSYFFTNGDHGPILIFWAHLGRASSDLYFADYPGGGLPTNMRLIARSIMSVSISAHVLFGILNVSQQDEVGDLVYRNIDTGVDTLYAHAVAEAVEYAPSGADLSGTWTAYLVRGRADSDHSGLWLTTLAPPEKLDGGAD